MMVFNNQQRSGYEEIVSYSPHYYRNIKEMDAVFRLAGWLVDFMARDMENMVAFQFLKYMDEESIARYETFLGIMRDSNKTLEERKAYINALLTGTDKFSADKIISIANQFVDCECSIQLLGAELRISMTFKDNEDKYIGEIRKLIRTIGPAHLRYRFSVRFCYATADEENFAMQNMVLGKVRFVLKMPFFSLRSYDGTFRYDGRTQYDSKRRYRIGAGMRLHCGVEAPKEEIGNLSAESRRNVQHYDGKKCYDGTTRYNAMVRKDVIE